MPPKKQSGTKKATKTKKEPTPPRPHVAAQTRAELLFPVGRIARYLRKGRYAQRLGKNSAVFLAAVMEYIVAEVIELAGNQATSQKRRRLNPRHIMLAIRSDEELNRLFSEVTFASSGVLPGGRPVVIDMEETNNNEDPGSAASSTRSEQNGDPGTEETSGPEENGEEP
ncbi:hypothetical protein L596_008976 [Steinernema carpocapsae]|uniref:Histone H2A n=1 Tax=Steinernema carpocapsae TaxID=34508 RepID=A0A4U5PEU7_STECR|nr:hypothetical protein L596_008976 [Steinernema carpocapsae]